MAPPHDNGPQNNEDSAALRSSPPTTYDSIQGAKNFTDSPDNTHPTEHSSSENLNSNDPPSNEYVLNIAFVSFVGFMVLQGFFAIIANSESMLADSEAMSVDAMTYLFNMWAERVKNRPPTEEQLKLPLAVREHRIELKRLYLELIPPLISVTTLIAVTISALKESFGTILAEDPDSEADVSAGLMLFFSGLNLLLDVLNVTCFARAQQAYGLQKTVVHVPIRVNSERRLSAYSSQRNSELAGLLSARKEDYDDGDYYDEENNNFNDIQGSNLARTDHTTHDSYFENIFGDVNLNMCSAWTVSFHFMVLSVLLQSFWSRSFSL